MSSVVGTFRSDPCGFLANLRTMAGMMRVYYREDRGAWYIAYRGTDNKIKRRRGGDTRSEAEVRLQSIVAPMTLVRFGLVSPQVHEVSEHSKRPIADMIEEYRADIAGLGVTRGWVKEVKRRLTLWAEKSGVANLQSVDAGRTARWLSDLIAAKKSYKTRNEYLVTAKSFLNWAVAYGRAATNPLKIIPLLDPSLDRRRVSKALTPEQLATLLSGVPLPRRAYYALAARMGLRWGEIRLLRWEQFDLASDRPVLALSADGTKARRSDVLPVPSDVAAILVAYRAAQRAIGGTLFNATVSRLTWKRDLRKAGIPYCDRKSTRLTFGSHLRAFGVDVRDASDLMRHRDIELTRRIYNDPRLVDLHKAVSNLGAHMGRTVTESKTRLGESTQNGAKAG